MSHARKCRAFCFFLLSQQPCSSLAEQPHEAHPGRADAFIGHPAGALGYDPHLPPTHASIIFDYGGEPTPYDPNWLRLTPTQARQLAREYVRTGRRPTTVAWHP